MDTVKGTRVYPNCFGYLVSLLHPGDYGRAILSPAICPAILLYPKLNYWWVILPNGDYVCLEPDRYSITEHNDGSISVKESICNGYGYNHWSGYITNGVFIRTKPYPGVSNAKST